MKAIGNVIHLSRAETNRWFINPRFRDRVLERAQKLAVKIGARVTVRDFNGGERGSRSPGFTFGRAPSKLRR